MANTRFAYTSEQRQQQVQQLTQQLEDGVKSVFESENYASYLKVMSQFTHYSVRNTILIAMQTGGQATMVAGYEAWQKKFGRHVNKGEKAIKIFAPMTYQRKKEVDVIDQATGQPARNADGSIRKEQVEVTVPSFRVTNVFDISQTSGPPLPQIVQDLDGNVEQYDDFLQAIRNISPVPIGFEEMEGKDGYYHQVEKRIAINEDLSQTQTMAALIHELAHAKLHALDPEHLKESAKARGKDQRTMEVEAESVSAVVSSYFGIDTSANSWGYVASWSRNKELPELTASLQVIKDTAGEIIDGMEEEMEELRYAYMDKQEALEAINNGEAVYTAIAKGRFQEATAEEVQAMPEDAWLRMPKDQMRQYLEVRTLMDLHEEVTDRKEAELLYLPENQFGIYQIDPEGEGRFYMFTSHDFMNENDMVINHKDYQLRYVAPLTEADDLNSIYERFNIDRPADFEGHSLSVSDVIVMNKDGEVKAYFVDSFGFEEVPEFLEYVYERPEEIHEAAFEIADRYLEIHRNDAQGGYDYSIFSEGYKRLDGGHYDSDLDLLTVAKDIAQGLKEPTFNTETQTYERIPLQGNIDANSRLRRISYTGLYEITQDMNQVNSERTAMAGTVQETSPTQRYKPLAKVEEQEEQNYNMVDNVLNNGYGEKERQEEIRQRAQEYREKTGASISFYAAECDEFKDMGVYYGDIPLAEAVQHYQEITSDPRRSYMGNAMGVILHDPSAQEYSDSPFPMVYGKAIHGETMDDVAAFSGHPLVLEALEQVREQFPDYKFIPTAEQKQALYPEKMTDEQLAGALVDLAREFDGYEFMDRTVGEERLITEVKYNLLAGDGMQEFAPFLKDVMEEDDKLAPRAEALLDRIKNFEPEVDNSMEPVAKFTFSQTEELPTDIFLPLAETDKAMREADAKQAALNQANEKDARIYIVEVSVLYAQNDQIRSLNETIYVGNGNGGVIDSIKAEVDQHLSSQAWLDYKKAQDPESYTAYVADLRDAQEHVLPYLQQFCSLEERSPELSDERTAQATAVEIGVMTATTIAATAKTTASTPEHSSQRSADQSQKSAGKSEKSADKLQTSGTKPQKSIHERLKENKEKLSKSADKGIPQRGVELA